MDGDTISIWKTLQRGFPRMHRAKRLRVSEVNPHLICVLCGGYYIDATTITECLHTFCKTCIVGYLEASKHCPVCDNLVHKTKPHLRLRPDHTLQDLVYKLVPGLFQDEMKKRREFYKDEIQNGKLGENGIPEERERIIYSAEEQISLVLELSSDGQPPINPGTRASRHTFDAADRRYLQCPANITIQHLKKFIRMKFNLCDRYQVDFYHTDESLRDHYTLVDVAYIYSWRRQGPLRLYYTIFTNPAKKFKAEVENLVPMETDITNKSDSRAETSGYISDDLDKSHDRSTDSGVSLGDSCAIHDGKTGSCPESTSDSEIAMDTAQQNNKVTVDEKATGNTDPRNISVTCATNDSEKNKADNETVLEKCRHSDIDIKSNGSKALADLIDKNPKIDIKEGGQVLCAKSETTVSVEHEQTILKDKQEITTEVEDKNDLEPKERLDTKTDSMTNKSDTLVSNNRSKSKECEESKESNSETAIARPNEKDAVKKVEQRSARSLESTAIKLSEDSEASVLKTVETSTCTSPIPFKEVRGHEIVSKPAKVRVSDDDVSEPVVSSTQNTQGCQTEPPESGSDSLEVPHSSEKENTKSGCLRSTVDVSCETDNFVLMREMSVESVSVSTETETEPSETVTKGKVSIDCSTDVFDFPNSETEQKQTVDCSTDFEGFPGTNNKRKALSVDCSTGMDDFDVSSSKRKVAESTVGVDTRELKETRKLESKVTKRSMSYGGYTSTPKSAYLAQPLSPTKITLKFTPPKSPVKHVPKSPPASRPDPNGFQSQYQSFVMELPNKTFEFHDESSESLTSPDKPREPFYKHSSFSSSPNLLTSVPKKVQTKSGRPRGRPPKNRSLESSVEPQKEKKHKSRSHSPKHRKHSEKSNDGHKDKYTAHEKRKHAQSPSGESSKQTSAATPYNWINKIYTHPKHSSERKSQKSKTESAETSSAELKIPKQFLYFSNGQYTLASESTLAALKKSSPVSPTRTVSTLETQTSTSEDKNYSAVKPRDKKHMVVSKSPTQKFMTNMDTKPHNLKTLAKHEGVKHKEFVQSNIKIDSNQNKIIPVSSPAIIKTQSSSQKSSDSKDDQKAVNTVKCTEYRHQSPFFASMSGAKLGQTHRIGTHLNIPNLSSHFSGTHHLYAHARYSADRLVPPSNLYRSFSLNDKSPTSPVVSKFQDKQRMESVPSPCGYMTPFPAAYLGLSHIHNHMISSLPASVSPKGYSPDSTRSPTHAVSESSANIGNSPSQSNTKTVLKSNSAGRKGKEKSIDNVISAITEMRAKKEEQLNGIDLSTKSSRQTDKSSSPTNEEKLDKFAFTDEEDVRVTPTKSAYRTEHVPVPVERKSAV